MTWSMWRSYLVKRPWWLLITDSSITEDNSDNSEELGVSSSNSTNEPGFYVSQTEKEQMKRTIGRLSAARLNTEGLGSSITAINREVKKIKRKHTEEPAAADLQTSTKKPRRQIPEIIRVRADGHIQS